MFQLIDIFILIGTTAGLRRPEHFITKSIHYSRFRCDRMKWDVMFGLMGVDAHYKNYILTDK
jgi:hypothetical protein